MKFSYNWLKEISSFKESPQKLADILTMRSFEVGGVEKIGNDRILDISILPNRVADSAGHIGLAREIAALLNSKFQIPNSLYPRKPEIYSPKSLKIKIEDKNDCVRYVGIVVGGVKVGKSPLWMRNRLEACGINAINNIVDCANYAMLETGQPSHIFDFDKIKEAQTANRKPQTINKSKNLKSKIIKIRRARKGETILTLDGQTLKLSEEILVVADAKNPVAVAGIKGGMRSGVSGGTSRIVIEAASFNPSVIRRGSKALNLKTDASYRFEHDLDPNLAMRSAVRLAELVCDIAGGEVKEIIDEYPIKTLPRKILLDPEYVGNLIGDEIAPRVMKEYLARLRMGVVEKNGKWLVEVPTIRRDIVSQEDIIEEIARLYGYNRIEAKPPNALMRPALFGGGRAYGEKIRDFFIGAGFAEAYSYAFSGDKEARDFGADTAEYIELENPASSDARYLARYSFFKYALILEQNLRHCSEARVFAESKDFLRKKKGVEERKVIVAAYAKKGEGGKNEFFEMKGVCDNLLRSLGIADFWYDDAINRQSAINNPQLFFHPYRFAEVKIGDKTIGEIGELHPAIAENIKLKARGVILRLSAENLFGAAESEREFSEIPKFPAVVRDIALIVPEGEKIEAVQGVIETAGGALLSDADLFDYFEDFDKGGGRMSVAFRLVFQSLKRTLTDNEIDGLMRKIEKAAAQRNWAVR